MGFTAEWGECAGYDGEDTGKGEFRYGTRSFVSIRGNGKGCILHRIIDSLTSHLQPPPTFQPPSLAPSTPSTTNTTAPKPPRPEHIDLIKRYNLGSKIGSTPPAPEEAGRSLQQTWSNNKNERQALLQRRREEMVLNARRKMEERERGKSRS